MNREQPSLVVGILLILILIPLIYSPVMQAGFIIDDQPFYIEDPLMNAADGGWRIWLHQPDDRGEWPYIPITRMTFWLERQLGGLNLQLSHGITLLFFLCALLSKTSTIILPVLFLFCCLWTRAKWKFTDIYKLLAFFLAALGFGLLRIWVEWCDQVKMGFPHFWGDSPKMRQILSC